ncbi:MAG: hypothetical protein V7677_10415 [Motiliproteus sp.]
MSNNETTKRIQHRDLLCGYATICAIPRAAGDPEQYALPGRQIVNCRDQARRAAVQLNDLIQANGGAQILRKAVAA